MVHVNPPESAPKGATDSLIRRGIGLGAIRLGDVIKALARLLGIEPCDECEKRAGKLNNLFSRSISSKK